MITVDVQLTINDYDWEEWCTQYDLDPDLDIDPDNLAEFIEHYYNVYPELVRIL